MQGASGGFEMLISLLQPAALCSTPSTGLWQQLQLLQQPGGISLRGFPGTKPLDMEISIAIHAEVAVAIPACGVFCLCRGLLECLHPL